MREIVLINRKNGLPQLERRFSYNGKTIEASNVIYEGYLEKLDERTESDSRFTSFKDRAVFYSMAIMKYPKDSVNKAGTIYTSTIANLSDDLGKALKDLLQITATGYNLVATMDEFDSDDYIQDIFNLYPIIMRWVDRLEKEEGVKRYRRDRKDYKSYSDFQDTLIECGKKKITKEAWAKKLNVTRPTLNNMIKDCIADHPELKDLDVIGKARLECSWNQYENFAELFDKNKKGDLSKVDWAKTIGVSRPTLQKLILEYEDDYIHENKNDYIHENKNDYINDYIYEDENGNLIHLERMSKKTPESCD